VDDFFLKPYEAPARAEGAAAAAEADLAKPTPQTGQRPGKVAALLGGRKL
jgi:hypothetical protein